MRYTKLLLLIAALGLLALPVFAVPFEDFDTNTGSINWNDASNPPYGTTINLAATGNPGKGLAITEVAIPNPPFASFHSANALVHGMFYTPQDWSGFSTLEFDAKVSTANLTGYSILLYNGAAPGVLLRAIQVTASGTFARIKIDISGVARYQISEMVLYVNRNLQNAGQTLTVDNFELTNNPVPATPNDLLIESFDTYTSTSDMFYESQNSPTKPWDHVNNVAMALQPGQFTTAPNAADITLGSGTSWTSYAERCTFAPGMTAVDLQGYNSIVFDAKVSRGIAYRQPPSPIGFALTVVGGGSSAPVLWFKPSAYDTWQTFRLNIAGSGIEQLKYLWFYVNRSTINDAGQILRIDNIRASKDLADTVPAFNPIIDDFENADITWWYYDSYHNVDGTIYNGVSHALTNDAASGSHAIKIRNELTVTNDPLIAQFPYGRKTMQQNWAGYSTLVFDAKTVDSDTAQGFQVAVKNGATYTYIPFWPTNTWRTYKVDISGVTRADVNQLLFYVNRQGDYGRCQNRHQELYIDNIRLTNDPVGTTYNTIAAAKSGTSSGTVTITGAVVTGVLSAAYPDNTPPQFNKHNVFFIEDTDRTAAIPVIWDGTTAVAEGNAVDVTGVIQVDKGNRIIKATAVTPAGTGTPAKPLGVTNKNIAGLPIGDLDTVGMLVTITGKAIDYKMDGLGRNWLYIDDGSGVTADLDIMTDQQLYGVKIPDSTGSLAAFVGQYVSAIGYALNDAEIDNIAGTIASTGRYCRTLWPKAEITDAVRVINP